MKKTLSLIAVLLVVPLVTFGAGPSLAPLYDLLNAIMGLVRTAVPILIGLALIAFFYGLVRYIFSGAAKGGAEGKNIMIWGIVALFVMISVWGIIAIGQEAFGINPNAIVPTPSLPGIR